MPELFESDGSATLPLDQLRKAASGYQTLDTDDGYESLITIRAQAYDNVFACAHILFVFVLLIGVYRCSSAVPSPKHAAELCRRSGIARENGLEIRSAEMLRGNLAKHVAEVCGQREVAAFVQLIALQARPVAVDFSTAHAVANHEHRIR